MSTETIIIKRVRELYNFIANINDHVWCRARQPSALIFRRIATQQQEEAFPLQRTEERRNSQGLGRGRFHRKKCCGCEREARGSAYGQGRRRRSGKERNEERGRKDVRRGRGRGWEGEGYSDNKKKGNETPVRLQHIQY